MVRRDSPASGYRPAFTGPGPRPCRAHGRRTGSGTSAAGPWRPAAVRRPSDDTADAGPGSQADRRARARPAAPRPPPVASARSRPFGADDMAVEIDTEVGREDQGEPPPGLPCPLPLDGDEVGADQRGSAPVEWRVLQAVRGAGGRGPGRGGARRRSSERRSACGVVVGGPPPAGARGEYAQNPSQQRVDNAHRRQLHSVGGHAPGRVASVAGVFSCPARH